MKAIRIIAAAVLIAAAFLVSIFATGKARFYAGGIVAAIGIAGFFTRKFRKR